MKKQYVLITPAYNEGEFIKDTIESVVSQTVLPVKWIIVDDGSTDTTPKIIKEYEKRYEFVTYHRRTRKDNQTYYESNVYAIQEGYEKVRGLHYDYIATLDADIILCATYYEEIFKRFDLNRDLGIATGMLLEKLDGRLVEVLYDRRSTPKALQVFRRECFDQIGGYIPCKNGGEDSCTEIMARMNGWQTWSFSEIRVIHRRSVGARCNSDVIHHMRFHQGLTDYCLATHPIFMIVKCLGRCLRENPYITSGLARFAGYFYGYLIREPRQIPTNASQYVRKEQIRRLLRCIGIGPQLWKPIQPESQDHLEGN